MSAAKSEPWKHHFVPRSLLRYFRPPGDQDFIYVFDKHTGRGFRTSLMNAGSENGFNTLEEDDGIVNFESDFDEVDAALARRLHEANTTADLAHLSTEQREAWADLVAVQLLRTPIVRSTMKTFVEDLKEQVAESLGAAFDVPVSTENDVRKAARNVLLNREDARQALLAKQMVLFEAPVATQFRISDRPVTVESSLPFGDAGLTSLGVAIFMPLGQRRMLGLLCPSIGRKLDNVPIETLDIADEARVRLIALRNGLSTGALVQLDHAMVRRHNDMQVAGCMRFVYGPTSDFEDVQTFLSSHPEAQRVQSSMKVGRMGGGPEPMPHMPMGSWLVLFGRNEAHMLETQDASDGEPLEVTVRNEAALEAALNDEPFSEMRYYVDRHERRGMRDVRLIVTDEDGKRRVQVRHSNPGLDALMTTIGSR